MTNNDAEPMTSLIDLLSNNSLLLLFFVIGLGSLAGSVKVFGFSLGPAAVLFTGIAVGAVDPRLRVPEFIYTFGLILFVYTIGLQSGSTFFSSFGKRGLRANVFAVVVILVGIVVGIVAAKLGGIDGGTIAGIFCGAMTNTPALAATVERIQSSARSLGVSDLANTPVVGYSIAYPFGVIGVLLVFHILGRIPRFAKAGTSQEGRGISGQGGAVGSRTFRVVNPGIIGKNVENFLIDESDWGIALSRLRRGEVTSLVYPETVFELHDLVVAVGDERALQRARELFGEEASRQIQYENQEMDYRRLEVSDGKVIGRTIRELRLQDTLDATITRVRRGDTDFVPTLDTVVERGDRVLVITWLGNMVRVARFFGDSIRASSEADFLSVSLGIVLGVLLGMAPLPLPGGGTFTLGFAGGPLIAGLVLGRIQRTGTMVWGMPFSANLTLRQIGLILFLAGVGTKAGDGFVTTLVAGGWKLIGIGAIITLSTSIMALVIGVRLLRLSFPAAMSMLSGIQTQPACLAYAVDHSSTNEPNIWYAIVYPASMITKIILAQVLVDVIR
jgi:putative transport protein